MTSDLIGVALGGLLGIGGTIGVQWLQHRLQSEENRRSQQTLKFEALVCAIYEYDDWLELQRLRMVFGENLTDTPSPYAKLLAVAAVSFPQFLDAIARLDAGAKKYRHWMATRLEKRREKKFDELNDGFDEAYSNYLNRRDDLLLQLLTYAKSEFASRS